MESLTRNNYEIWFLDYLDGQLSNEQLECLLDFLELNPDLKQELLGVSGVSLTPGTESIELKEQFLKTTDDIPGIATMDQLCIARMENDLTEEEAHKFDIRLDEDMELKGSYSAFLHTRLNRSDKMIFPYKKDLRKKVVFFSPWLITAISSAAVVLLVWTFWPDPSEKVVPEIAGVETPVVGKEAPAVSTLPSTKASAPSKLLAAAQGPSVRKRSVSGNMNPETGKQEIMQREIVPMKSLSRRTAVAGPRIPDPQSIKLLYASNFSPTDINIPENSSDALTLPQFALQLFRERVLGQDRQLVKKTRFSMWEVAGAGVNKINDLAGTQMELNREYDAKGDILAVSFNSRLIDVESPVKTQGN